MHHLPPRDGDRVIDWGRTSADYAAYRPGPPLSFFQRLQALDVGLPGQAILDLGTGTGVVARQFARQQAHVAAVDVSPEQVRMEAELARRENLRIDWAVAAAEQLPWCNGRFQIATANQCWLYFDTSRAIAELRRILRPGGWLVTSHFCWLPRRDPIARATEELVLRFNRDWSAADWSGTIPAFPTWAEADFRLRGMFYYDQPIQFTHESWRGRMRACRGVGAALTADEIARFDQELQRLIQRIAPEPFTILHRIDAHILELRDKQRCCVTRPQIALGEC